MTQIQLIPSGEGSRYPNWVLGAGASKLVAIQTNDGDTSYIDSTGGTAQYHSASFNALPGYVISVTSIQIGAYLRWISGATNGSVGMYPGSVGDYWTAVPVVAGTYTLYQDSNRAVNPATAAAWSISEANSTLAEIVNDTGSANVLRCTMLYSDVYAVVAEGTFAFLAASLAGAAVGLAEMGGLARAIHRKTRTRIMPDEYLVAWRELREARRPVYLF